MKLIVKFNLVFLLIFAIGLTIAAYISRDLLERNARDEVLQNARIMMEAALATRTYTSNQVRSAGNSDEVRVPAAVGSGVRGDREAQRRAQEISRTTATRKRR